MTGISTLVVNNHREIWVATTTMVFFRFCFAFFVFDFTNYILFQPVIVFTQGSDILIDSNGTRAVLGSKYKGAVNLALPVIYWDSDPFFL